MNVERKTRLDSVRLWLESKPAKRCKNRLNSIASGGRKRSPVRKERPAKYGKNNCGDTLRSKTDSVNSSKCEIKKTSLF
jgi:hypothetical protein